MTIGSQTGIRIHILSRISFGRITHILAELGNSMTFDVFGNKNFLTG